MDYYYKVLKGHVFPWHKIEDYVNAENFPFFFDYGLHHNDCSPGAAHGGGGSGVCALSLTLTPCCKGGAHKRQREAAAHIKRGVRPPPPPLGWLASFIINAMRAGDLDFEKLSSNTGIA